VDDSQLSLAIGKKGQNVRLAAKLLGWKIDIKSEEEKRQEVEQQMSALVGTPTTPLDQVPDLGEGVVEKLSAAGVTTVEGLADMTPEQLEEIPGIGPKTVEKISLAVSNYFAGLEAAAAAAGDGTAAEAMPDEPTPDETAEITAAPDDLGANADDAGQSGGSEGLSETATESADSVRDLADTGQALEADAVEGVEDAPTASEADSAEVHVHGEEPHEGEK
jgi:transcription termination/antitermination protein NusA